MHSRPTGSASATPHNRAPANISERHALRPDAKTPSHQPQTSRPATNQTESHDFCPPRHPCACFRPRPARRRRIRAQQGRSITTVILPPACFSSRLPRAITDAVAHSERPQRPGPLSWRDERLHDAGDSHAERGEQNARPPRHHASQPWSRSWRIARLGRRPATDPAIVIPRVRTEA